MTKRVVTIAISDEVYQKLLKRAKREALSVDDLCSDIIRRSAISSSNKYSTADNIDDALIGIFSKKRRKEKKSRVREIKLNEPEENEEIPNAIGLYKQGSNL